MESEQWNCHCVFFNGQRTWSELVKIDKIHKVWILWVAMSQKHVQKRSRTFTRELVLDRVHILLRVHWDLHHDRLQPISFSVFQFLTINVTIPVMICHVIIPMRNRMLYMCNVQKLILEIKFEEHRLQSCECREWNRENSTGASMKNINLL